MSAGIQLGVDATRELENLEEDVHAASRSETLYGEKGKCHYILFHERADFFYTTKNIEDFYLSFNISLVI